MPTQWTPPCGSMPKSTPPAQNPSTSSNKPSYTYTIENQTTAVGSDSYTYMGATQDERLQVNSTSYVYGLLGLSSQTDTSDTTLHADLVGARNVGLRTLVIRQDWMSTGQLSVAP